MGFLHTKKKDRFFLFLDKPLEEEEEERILFNKSNATSKILRGTPTRWFFLFVFDCGRALKRGRAHLRSVTISNASTSATGVTSVADRYMYIAYRLYSFVVAR